MKKKCLTLIGLLLPLTGCSSSDVVPNALYASVYPAYVLAKEVVQDLLPLKMLTPFGSEPHDYEPSVRHIIGLTECKGLLLQGNSLEPWADSLPKEVKEKTFDVSKDIETMKVDGVIDPHVWMSPKNAKIELANILDSLIQIDPAHQEDYEENARSAFKKMEELDQRYTLELQGMSRPYLVVSHASFGYLCRDYGLEQIYVSGLSPDQEPTAKGLERIIEEVRLHQITTIFYEEYVSPSIAKKIAEETGCKTEVLSSLETIEESEDEKQTYFSLMEENLIRIKEALQ